MLISSRHAIHLVAVLMLIAGVPGCSTIRLPDVDEMLGRGNTLKEEEQHRRNYQSDRDPADLRWLLANRISSGMSVSEVGRVIGEDGRRLYDDNWIKNGGGYYQTGDEAWKWEQDRNGQSLILVFREGRLVNFDPSDYQEPSDSFDF